MKNGKQWFAVASPEKGKSRKGKKKTVAIYESKQNKMCVWILASGKSLTVFYIVPHWHELCLQFFHLVAPFRFHLGQRRTESIPTPLSNSASEQWDTEHWTANTIKPATDTNRAHKCTPIRVPLKLLPYNFLHTCVFYIQVKQWNLRKRQRQIIFKCLHWLNTCFLTLSTL